MPYPTAPQDTTTTSPTLADQHSPEQRRPQTQLIVLLCIIMAIIEVRCPENADQCDIAEGPWNLNNPVKASRSHQELHKELLLAHKKGLVVCCKPELQTVLERRKREQTQREEGEQSRSPLEQVLLQRQQKHQEMMKEKEEEQKLHEEVQLMEFVRVRQNLKKVHTALQKNIHS
ncbi:Protein FAM107B [Anabarilius grahami]|uniref:Protein FAM107B n=1 Tax=Anabarilius grahami TaxID=495550 RepID=A0A3N0Y5X0_ANAGA|nr:Protein FAM107B [Anabarilius grahami]